nr:immunoglobulin light chain junction region [Macaca mulatta]MPN94671.1 immunoglobulin light chain junction region [Macaca mulatta]MPN96477.1 immunoglobulin light chain junction region [Macaca mulatta]
CMRVLQTPFTF